MKASKKAKGVGGGKIKSGSSSWLRSFIEFVFFALWLVATGFAGYLVGQTPSKIVCPQGPSATTNVNTQQQQLRQEILMSQQPQQQQQQQVPPPKCHPVENKGTSGVAIGAVSRPGGFTYNEILQNWKCSQASYNFTQASQNILPKEGNLDKTKWKSILSVEPKAFFDKYLRQYPGDVRAVQPVVVFSHRELKSFDEISDVCKVIDISIVPDTPGVCVAVTETYHDVASYHMLHAEKQSSGEFVLTNNHIEGRIIPEESAYEASRGILLDYFENANVVSQAVKRCPNFSDGRVSIGTLIETPEELELFQNSLASADKMRISFSKFCVFTTSDNLAQQLKSLAKNAVIVPFPQLANIGRGNALITAEMRTYFLQAWLAFAVARNNNKMLWQSPGTIWLGKPDDISRDTPVSETIWSFRGRADSRAAPFFVSLDLFVVTGYERAVHLAHELLLHFDLVLAWNSLDSVAAYRLAENNARYGTTTIIWPPNVALHVDLLDKDVKKLQDALSSSSTTTTTTTAAEIPQVVIIPRHGFSSMKTTPKQFLQDAKLWYI